MAEPEKKPVKKTVKSGANKELSRSTSEALVDMPIFIRERIERCLDIHVPGASNWPNFAEHFSIENEVINHWDSRKNQVPLYSPSQFLLDKLRAEQPELTVDDLRQVCIVKQRHDVVRIIDEYYVNEK